MIFRVWVLVFKKEDFERHSYIKKTGFSKSLNQGSRRRHWKEGKKEGR